jgi:hypothetical protein
VSEKNITRFFDSIENVITANLKSFSNQSLNKQTCFMMYQSIFNSVVEVFSQAKVNVSNEFMNYVSQQFYLDVRVNDNVRLDPNIFTKLAKVTELNDFDLRVAASLFQGTHFFKPVYDELKKR